MLKTTMQRIHKLSVQGEHASSHPPERVTRRTAPLLRAEIGLIIADLGLAILGLASRHEADFSLADDSALSQGFLLGLHVLGTRAERAIARRVGACR